MNSGFWYHTWNPSVHNIQNRVSSVEFAKTPQPGEEEDRDTVREARTLGIRLDG